MFFWDQSLCPLNKGVPKVPDHISTSKAVWLHVQSNPSVMATLGTEESGHCRELAFSGGLTVIFVVPMLLSMVSRHWQQ